MGWIRRKDLGTNFSVSFKRKRRAHGVLQETPRSTSSVEGNDGPNPQGLRSQIQVHRTGYDKRLVGTPNLEGGVMSEPCRSFSFFVRRSSFFPFIASPFLFPLNHVMGVRLERCRSSHQERVFCFPFSSRLTPTLSHRAITNRFTPHHMTFHK